jgi:hypothetical protein
VVTVFDVVGDFVAVAVAVMVFVAVEVGESNGVPVEAVVGDAVGVAV